MSEQKKYRTVIIDTISELQDNRYVSDLQKAASGKLTFDEWRNYGVDILGLYEAIKSLKDVIMVQVLGYEGTGKSMGASFLDPDQNFWLNIDKKPLPWLGWRKKYPPDNSRKNYKSGHDVKTYDEVLAYIIQVHKRSKTPLIVFILGHLEDYRSTEGEMRQRLRVIGKMPHKHNLEGALVHSYYTHIDDTKDVKNPERYMLAVHNSGHNTARSPHGYWEDAYIPNNYQLIVDKIVEDWGGY